MDTSTSPKIGVEWNRVTKDMATAQVSQPDPIITPNACPPSRSKWLVTLT